jgi:Tfp pilus assembly protein PilF
MRAILVFLITGALVEGASLNLQVQEAKRLRADGRAAQAGQLFRQVVEQAKGLNSTDPKAAEDLNNLGVQYYEMARYAEAETLYRLALKAWPAGNTRDAALTLGNLGSLLRTTGRYSEAESLLSDSLHRLDALGDPLSAGRVLDNLAALYRATGSLPKAEAAALRAGELFARSPAAGEMERTTQALLLASVYIDQHRYDQAEAILRGILGTANPAAVFTVYNDLTTIALARDQFDEAGQDAREALDRARKALPAGHPALATALNNMAQACRFLGRYLDAEKYYRDAIVVWEDVVGPDHPDLARGLMNLAAFYHDRERETGAEDLYERAAAILERTFGKNDPLTLVARNELADVLRAERRFAEAERLGKSTLAALEKALGPDDPRVERAWEHQVRLAEETRAVKSAGTRTSFR